MNLTRIRSRFPALRRRPDGLLPDYLDSACMSLVPTDVIRAMEEYYRDFPGCAGRSLHRFAEEVSHRFEATRDAFAKYLNAPDRDSVIFVRGATEAMNLVGQGIDWARGDRVLVTDQEHNSNLVLWQRLAKERGIVLDWLPLPEDGTFDFATGVRLVSFFQTSNLDGRSLPVQEITERAHARGAEVMFDGCQSAPHATVDLKKLGVDYYAVSAHKMLGPTGTGVLVGRPEPIQKLRPLLMGGNMVEWTTLTDHALRGPPHRFEAGLQNYAGVLGAHAGLKFLESVGHEEIQSHDRALNERVTKALAGEPRVRLIGPKEPARRASIFAFAVDGVDPNDGALFLDAGHGVLVRSGMHCVHSWYRSHGLTGNLRASFYFYNTPRDADRLVAGVRELVARLPAGPSAPAAA